MADPVHKQVTWSKAYPAYAEKHDMYRAFQELLKELIIFKPNDPLAYIRDEISNIAEQLHVPRAFLVGPNVSTQGIGRRLAQETGAKYLTLTDIVETAPKGVRGVLAEYVQGCHDEARFDDTIRKVLVAAILLRVRHVDCHKNGYVLYGFPQTKEQAVTAQQAGLLPRQVFVLLPEARSSSSMNSKASQNLLNKRKTELAENSTSSSQGPATGNPAGPTNRKSDYKEIGQGVIKVTSHLTLPDIVDYSHVKAIADCYDYEICKVFSYDKWSGTKKLDIEDELLASMIAIKPCGSPWIPKILLFGPPYSGKNTLVEALAAKFGFINVSFLEVVRAATRFTDSVGTACKKYLRDMSVQALTDDVVRELLKKALNRNECVRKGWILHGFPDTLAQLKCLDQLHSTPNRVFYLACPEDHAWRRLITKRQEILGRKMNGADNNLIYNFDENNFEEFPYGKVVFRKRTDLFYEHLNAITTHFGEKVIYVDGTQHKSTIQKFIEEAILRPPVVRYHEATPGPK